MEQRRLTKSLVEAFTCRPYTSGKYKGTPKPQDTLWDTEVRGFGMRLSSKTGTRAYIFVARVKGTHEEVFVTIGRHGDPYNVDQARAEARGLKAQVVKGINPVREQEKRVAELEHERARELSLSTTLRQVMEHYVKHRRTKHGPLRTATKDDIRYHCENNLAEWLDQPIAKRTRDDCLMKFNEITDRGAPRQANACMGYFRALCNHAREMHALPDGTYPILAVNPVTQMFRLQGANAEKRGTGRIPLNKLGEVWSMLRRRATTARADHWRVAADWVCCMIITGARKTESGSLKRENVDLVGKTVTLLGDVKNAADGFEGTKNHHDIVLPMSGLLYEILVARMSEPVQTDNPASRRPRRERDPQYVFPGFGRKRPYITDARHTMSDVSRIVGFHVKNHDLRRTFEDVAQACGIDADVRRMLFNHIDGDVHSKHYANGVQSLAAAMEAIGKHVAQAARLYDAQASGANVIAFSAKSA